MTAPEQFTDVDWIQVAVGPSVSGAPNKWQILGTSSMASGVRSTTMNWDTAGYSTGEYEVLVNVGTKDGKVHWGYERGVQATYTLR